LVIPAKLRRQLGIADGSWLLLTQREDSFELRLARLAPATAAPSAADLLAKAENLGEYLAAIEELRRLGVEPEG
jgi:bifunctional DNA-binding transcriptional regulator/antitoxin component of YhaV-PrlF toxin-antitoxin module